MSRLIRGGFSVILATALLLPTAGRGQEIIINEVMASNQSTTPLAEYTDYFPDYVELYNNSGREIDLAAEQWAFSTKAYPEWGLFGPDYPNYDFKDFFVFPPGTPLFPADSYLLVFFDGDTNVPGIHTTFTKDGTNVTFSLNRNGESLRLYKGFTPYIADPTNFLVDSVMFGFQLPTNSIGRVPDFTGGFTLTVPTPCGGTIPCLTNIPTPFLPAPASSNALTLKMNEWLATNSAGSDRDWLEIFNPDTNVVSLSGLVFVDKTENLSLPFESRPIPPLTFIAPFGFVQFFATDNEDADRPAEELSFSISSDSIENLFMFASDRTTLIDKVLSNQPRRNTSQGRLPDGGDVFPGRLPNLSPEASNFGSIPEVAINEVLTHTDPPLEDAIELVNNTNVAVNIGNWWLTNNRNDPMKYRIPAGTMIPAGGYAVFYEYQFNNSNTAAKPFTLNSANGDELYLYKADASGKLLGYRRGIDFGPAENGVSFGRYILSDGSADTIAMTDLSLGTSVRAGDPERYQSVFRTGIGAANPGPLIGPLVINEIHYQPPPIGANKVDDDLNEFVEVHNISDQPVPLYDPVNYGYADGRTNTWRIRGGVDFDFPRDIVLGAGEFLLVVNFSPTNAAQLAAFRALFNVPADVPIFGPYGSKLSNGGADVEVRRPDAPQAPGRVDEGVVPYIVVDRVRYDDEAPWPTNTVVSSLTVGPDGGGQSLQRISSYAYGNDAINWRGANPTPGRFNSATGDEPPSILDQPQNRTVTAGSTVSFQVTARGTPLLFYQWLSDGVAMAGQTQRTLTLQNVNTTQSGGYSVIVSNVGGSLASAVATLTVMAPNPETKRPTIAIKTPTTAVVTTELGIVTGTASDNVGVNTVLYSFNDEPFTNASPDNVKWSSWRTDSLNFRAGTNMIRAYAIDQIGNHSLTNTRSYFLSSRTPLELTINGQGAVTGATNGQMLELGRNFILTATPKPGNVFSNWVVSSNGSVSLISTSPTLSYSMVSNTAVEANFVPNPFAMVAGKFNGLFYETSQSGGVLHGSSGFFTLTLTDRGAYTASVLSGGFKLSATGQLDLDGRATNTIVRKGTNALIVTWHVDLGGSDEIAGTVTDPVAGWSATLEGDRATFTKTNPCPQAGKYTLLLPGLPHDEFVPGGHSYGTVSIDGNGVATLKGYLSDKTSAAQKAPLSKNGEWPLYVPLYSGKGSLLSWVAFSDQPTNDFRGLLNWSKPMMPASTKYYRNGFTTNESEVVGSRYAAPVGATNKVLQMSAGQLSFTGGNLAEDTVNPVALGLSSKVTNQSPYKLTMSFTLSSGLFKGSYTPTNAKAKAVSFAGAVLQKGTNAAGYYLGTNQSGRVLLEAAP